MRSLLLSKLGAMTTLCLNGWRLMAGRCFEKHDAKKSKPVFAAHALRITSSQRSIRLFVINRSTKRLVGTGRGSQALTAQTPVSDSWYRSAKPKVFLLDQKRSKSTSIGCLSGRAKHCRSATILFVVNRLKRLFVLWLVNPGCENIMNFLPRNPFKVSTSAWS